jgi:hypothetical protein
MLQNLPRKLPKEKIRRVLEVHSQTQPWHPELVDGIEPTIERIEMYKASKYQ